MRSPGLSFAWGVVCLACADPGGTEDPDAPPLPDGAAAGDTFPGSDAAPMSVPDFQPCGDSVECAGPDSACVPVAPLDGASLCLPACEASASCPVDTFCWARTDGPYALLFGRCFWSYCGESFGNGVTGGPCRVGAEQEIPWAEQVPGWCYPIHDGVWGRCLETGELAAGQACDGPEARCRGDGCRNCGPGTVCAEGTCRELCDPRLLLEAAGDAPCAEGQGCRDRSELHVFDTGLGRGTWGTCEPGAACLLAGEGSACPPSEDLEPQGCVPTNPVRPTGFCDERGDGELETGEVCPADPPAGDVHECAAGTLCVAGPSAATCQAICDVAGARAPCPEGTTCMTILWSVDPPVRTQDWGTCR